MHYLDVRKKRSRNVSQRQIHDSLSLCVYDWRTNLCYLQNDTDGWVIAHEFLCLAVTSQEWLGHELRTATLVSAGHRFLLSCRLKPGK